MKIGLSQVYYVCFFYVPYYTPTNNTDFEILIQIDLADFTGWISFQLSKFIEEININP